MARHFLNVFKDSEAIVTPSGSCASMVKHYYHELFKGQPEEQLAHDVAAKTYELTQYLVDVLGVSDVGTTLSRPTTAMIHDACHGLRGLGIGPQPRALLANVKNLQLVTLPGADQCCGFGGLFAVKMSEISGAMLNDKMTNINATDAEHCDYGRCELFDAHERWACRGITLGSALFHIAEVLAGRI